MHSYTALVIRRNDKNKQLTLPMQTRICRKNYVSGSVNLEGHLKNKKINQARRLCRPRSIYLCQKTNPARETVPLTLNQILICIHKIDQDSHAMSFFISWHWSYPWNNFGSKHWFRSARSLRKGLDQRWFETRFPLPKKIPIRRYPNLQQSLIWSTIYPF